MYIYYHVHISKRIFISVYYLFTMTNNLHIYMYIHTYKYICIHAYFRMNRYVLKTHKHTHTHTHAHTFTHKHTFTHILTDIYIDKLNMCYLQGAPNMNAQTGKRWDKISHLFCGKVQYARILV